MHYTFSFSFKTIVTHTWCRHCIRNFEKIFQSNFYCAYICVTAPCTCWCKLAETANPTSLITIILLLELLFSQMDLYGHFKITSLIYEVTRSVSFSYSILLALSLNVQVIHAMDKNKKI
jgi:hypothetical protein